MEIQKRLVVRMLKRRPCPRCGRRSRRADLKLLRGGKRIWIYDVTCPFCPDGRLMVLTGEKSRRRRLSELTTSEQSYFEQQPPIGPDDVLDIHRFLESFQGDLKTLVRRS